ncbi:uncharacterized protein LOC132264614 isoform X2 [Phlebotomus argentipes]|uniref:uncharacterized protein LOC132264614 isoform X2 n=1 Tax=Phlebotomus argentipes TaxID=94469 RepID=UPI00289323C1|nr:uncharacterized protein LOC132264614 isoform X2 [Phlebotomus argentipes]
MHLKSLILPAIGLIHLGLVFCMDWSENPYKFPEVLSRRKRYLVFPPGSTVLCTLSVVKAFVFKSPAQHNMVMEVDFYYPLPDKLIFPERKNPAPIVVTTQKATVAPPVLYHDSFPHDDFYNLIDYHDRMDTTRRKSDKDVFLQKTRYPFSYKKYQSDKNHLFEGSKGKHWQKQHYRGHRERRDFYRSIENFINTKDIGLDGRSCILRTICEAQHWLMPKGTSLFDDIFRLLFSLPEKYSYVDDYSRAMSSEEKHCSELYEKKCPISILGLILHSEKVI